jgi:uracil-DNA glycosylase
MARYLCFATMVSMEIPLDETWKKILKDELSAEYFNELMCKVNATYLHHEPIYPPQKLIFRAFDLCPYNRIKVVIIGQDPYHNEGQAHGLSFSVEDTARIPPSLKNIFKEISNDLNTPIRTTGNLADWAEQGVLLLNATLTVEAHRPGSHRHLGWEKFTDSVIEKISHEKEHVVFLLWGKYAEGKHNKIDTKKHLVLIAPHPSPLSAYAGFFGCKHFSKTNTYLKKHMRTPITW